jgi:hypothetical protein
MIDSSCRPRFDLLFRRIAQAVTGLKIGEWMRSGSCSVVVLLFSGMAVLGLPSSLHSQQVNPALAAVPSGTASGPETIPEALPDVPTPQIEATQADEPQSNQQKQPAASPAPAQGSSSSSSSQNSSTPQAAAPPPGDQQSQHDKAEQQLKEQEHQRVLGVMASFNTTSNQNALPLSSGQKFRLFFKSATDPWPFGLAAVVAGIGQADNSYPAWGQGTGGYASRFGAAYSDYFIGNFFGNALLPSLWHEDPRYYQKGTGSSMSRFLWAAGSTVWCKRDNGHWGPNYANFAGNLIGAAIARAYYPPSERTVADVITDGLTVSAEGIVGAEVIEFWPDMVRHHKRKQAEKLARQAAGKDGQGAVQAAPKDTPAKQPQQDQNPK